MMNRSVVEYHHGRTFIAVKGNLIEKLDDSAAFDRRARDMVSHCIGSEVEPVEHRAPSAGNSSVVRHDEAGCAVTTLFAPVAVRQSSLHRNRSGGLRWRAQRTGVFPRWLGNTYQFRETLTPFAQIHLFS